MKNVPGLPDRWAVNIKAEAEHPRMGEFKAYFKDFNYIFDCEYYGFNIREDSEGKCINVSNYLPEGVTLITIDQFFEALDAPKLRFKTEAEFIAEFGMNFRSEDSDCCWNNQGKMDYLFGLPCKKEWVGHHQVMYQEKTKGDADWTIYEHLVTTAPLPVITDAEKKGAMYSYLEMLEITDAGKSWQPKRGELVEYSGNNTDWYGPLPYYDKCGEIHAVQIDSKTPVLTRFVRQCEQPTTLKIEDAKSAYIKALGLEGKKIDWV